MVDARYGLRFHLLLLHGGALLRWVGVLRLWCVRGSIVLVRSLLLLLLLLMLLLLLLELLLCVLFLQFGYDVLFHNLQFCGPLGVVLRLLGRPVSFAVLEFFDLFLKLC